MDIESNWLEELRSCTVQLSRKLISKHDTEGKLKNVRGFNPKKEKRPGIKGYMWRKSISDQRLFLGQSNSDECEIKNDGQRDLRVEEASSKNVKSVQENLTLAKAIPSKNARSIPEPVWCWHYATLPSRAENSCQSMSVLFSFNAYFHLFKNRVM